jgi:endonuclease/exonuclease/phosphatase family metal-dependent hydrolase
LQLVLHPFILGLWTPTIGKDATSEGAIGRILAAMSLRILTQNLYNGRADPSSFAKVLRDQSPDVVAVQELSTNCAEVLAEWGSATLLEPRDDTTGMGLAVRGQAALSRLDFPNRNPVRAILLGAAWGRDADVEIINAHLVNPVARPMKVSLRLRMAEIAALEGILNSDPSPRTRVLVGDLNSSPAWPIYRRLAKVATDAARAAGTARRTWGPRPASPRLLRIDHAFVQRAHVVRTQLVTVRGADHRGLLVELR